MGKVLIIRDDVHGDIQFADPVRHIVDAPTFQRLRHITQNGLLYLVYPGMRHSRFEHSIGAYHFSALWFSNLKMIFSDSQYADKFLPIKKNFRTTDGKTLMIEETRKLLKLLFKNDSEASRWKNIITTAALLHDVGHGPLSHTLEHFKLINPGEDYDEFCSTSAILKFLKTKKLAKENFKHEDMSLIYCDQLLTEIKVKTQFYHIDNKKNLICVAALIHKDFKKCLLEKQFSTSVSDRDMDYISLLSPIISGLFDVDRMDYMKRDSLKAGVKFGLVETDRLIKGLCPILISTEDSKVTAALIAKSRLVHTMDHFLISLFELYTNVYHHPTNELVQQQLKELFKNKKLKKSLRLNVKKHISESDATFLARLNKLTGSLSSRIIGRDFAKDRIVTQVYARQSTSENSVDDFKVIVSDDGRPVIKDGIDIWLIDGKDKLETIQSWKNISMVANKLNSETYLPSIWWKNPSFIEALDKFLNEKARRLVGKRSSRKTA